MEKFLKVNVKLPAPVEIGVLVSAIQFFRYEDCLCGKKKLQSHNLAQKAAASLLASQPQSQSRAVIHEATRQADSGDGIVPFVLKHTCADIVKPRFVAQHPRNFNLLAEAYRLALVNGHLQKKVSSIAAPATPHRAATTGFTMPQRGTTHPRPCWWAAACSSDTSDSSDSDSNSD